MISTLRPVIATNALEVGYSSYISIPLGLKMRPSCFNRNCWEVLSQVVPNIPKEGTFVH
jgi:hypothetical protein